MSKKTRSFALDLSESSGILYLNGAIMHNPRAAAYFIRRAPKMLFSARASEGCIQVKAAIVSPREWLLYSYWENEAALRRFYTSDLHVDLMRTVFNHPDWFTLYNETYALPISARYWNEANGYALTQSGTPETADEFIARTGAATAIKNASSRNGGSPG